MKQIIGIVIFALFFGHTFAQSVNQSNVPAVVLNAFQVKFPNADDTKWKLENGNYRVDYEVNNKDNKLILDYKGNVLQHQQDLYVSEIPKVVLETIKSRVAYYDVDDADRLTEGEKITYHINFDLRGEEFNFWIDEKGRLLKLRQELKDSEVPEPLVSLINTRFGSLDIERAKYVEEDGKIIYILRGEINDKDHYFKFDDKASLLNHNQDLRNTEIPVPVLNAAKAAYPGFEIRDADLLEEGNKLNYKLQLRKSKEKVYVYFSPDGKILEVK